MKKIALNIGAALLLIGIAMYIIGVFMFHGAQAEIDKYTSTKGAQYISPSDQATLDSAKVERDYSKVIQIMGAVFAIIGLISAGYGWWGVEYDELPATMLCPRCECEMRRDRRYCPKCGLKIIKRNIPQKL